MATGQGAGAGRRADGVTPTLATARLVLRPRVPGDAAALFATMSDPACMTWWSHAPVASVAALADKFAINDAGPWRAWAITRAGDDTAIGFVAAGERRAGVAEIGYLVALEAWGQGIAQEAVAAVIDQLFAEGCRRVFADTDPDNARSIALLRRLGVTLEGQLRAEWKTHIGVRDTALFGLLRNDWPTRR